MFDDVHFSIMLATLVIFLAVMIILNSMLYKPLLKFIDERSASISNDEEKVKQNFAEMSNFNEEFERIKQKALNEARNKAEEELKQKRLETEQKMEIFYAELSKEKEELEQELKLRLPLWQEALKNNLKNI